MTVLKPLVCLGTCLSVEHYRRFAQLTVDNLYEPPWEINWHVGMESDPPTAHGSAFSFIKVLALHEANFLLYTRSPPGEDHAPQNIVGYAAGAVLDQTLLEEFSLRREASAQPGDYYCAACFIDQPHRSVLIGDKKVYRHMCELRLKLAEASGAPRVWVRSHVAQTLVTGMYKKLGFEVVCETEVPLAGGFTRRVLMVKYLRREC